MGPTMRSSPSMAASSRLSSPVAQHDHLFDFGPGQNFIADLFTAGSFRVALALPDGTPISWRAAAAIRSGVSGFQAVGRFSSFQSRFLLLIVIIFGGVRSASSPRRKALHRRFYALFVTVFVYRQMSWNDFKHATFGAVRTTAMVLLIIGMAGAFSWLMAFLKVPASLVAWMNTISENPIIILLLINVLLLLLGTFMDMGPTIIICTPIFLPVAQAYGIDPVHFGVIMILNFGIGLNTPPVGAVQFVCCAVGKISVWEAMRSIWPFYGAGLVVLGLVTYIPALSLWLPSVFR